MKSIILRPAEPDRDFGLIAALISSQEDSVTSESDLREDVEKHRDQMVRMVAAGDEHGELLGFSWAYRDRQAADLVYFYLVVRPERRGQGAGRRLYADLAQAAAEAGAKTLRTGVRDGSPESLAFAERRGFAEYRHQIAMSLDLDAFDDRPYDAIIARLTGEGFRFTTMEELGDTQEAQRKLYLLNDTTVATTPGQEGEHPWTSFDDFQKSVCRSGWYKPGGQIVAVDTLRGDWAAMSAITRMDGSDYAYNLFTGVDTRYRGRKLGQAVKVLALRYARQALKVHSVHTHHNTKNLPMIAIDRKLGYVLTAGTILMGKSF